jgi:aspartyl-tRNA(Asn)/glutamyl-tRNA(Gln) amidotransferase subunit C
MMLGLSPASRIHSMSAITRAEVAHLAKLARLDLSEAELDHYATQLDVILGAVARVSEVATPDVAPTSHPIPMTNVFREDVRHQTLTAEAALSAAPSVEDSRFRVPRILDES